MFLKQFHHRETEIARGTEIDCTEATIMIRKRSLRTTCNCRAKAVDAIASVVVLEHSHNLER